MVNSFMRNYMYRSVVCGLCNENSPERLLISIQKDPGASSTEWKFLKEREAIIKPSCRHGRLSKTKKTANSKKRMAITVKSEATLCLMCSLYLACTYLLFEHLLYWPHIAYIAIITKATPHYVLTESTISGP